MLGTKKHKNLVVIGSGPVGMISALMLKDHFDNVILLERQSKENFLRKHGFTFPIVFSPASIKILESVDAWKPIKAERSEFFGVVIHKRIMGKEFEYAATQDGVFSHWRNHIIAKLYARIVEEKIPIYFDADVLDVDFQDNICKESSLGSIPFDLLLGADGINSTIRGLMAKAHPQFTEDEFSLTSLDKWYAYRLPAKGKLRKKFGGGERYLANHVYIDNLASHPSDKFRVVTTSMRQPIEEISILLKHGAELNLQQVKALNELFFGQYVDSIQDLNEAWDAGYAGKFEQVQTPTYCLNSALLIGDAAHGFESAGDLINMGLTSIGSFYEIFNRNSRIPEALREYDESVGDSLRFYANFSYRRSQEKIAAEVAAFEIGARLGFVHRHPSLFGIYEDDFEIRKYLKEYRRDLLKLKLFFFGIPITIFVLAKFMPKRQNR